MLERPSAIRKHETYNIMFRMRNHRVRDRAAMQNLLGRGPMILCFVDISINRCLTFQTSFERTVYGFKLNLCCLMCVSYRTWLYLTRQCSRTEVDEVGSE